MYVFAWKGNRTKTQIERLSEKNSSSSGSSGSSSNKNLMKGSAMEIITIKIKKARVQQTVP